MHNYIAIMIIITVCVCVCRDTGEFETDVDLPPGTHEYKYLVNGAWTHDTSQVTTHSLALL